MNNNHRLLLIGIINNVLKSYCLMKFKLSLIIFSTIFSLKLFAYHPLEDKYDVLFYKLNFNVTNANSLFNASVEIKAKAIMSMDTMVFELRKQNMIVDSIFKESVKIADYQQDSAKSIVLVPLGGMLNSGDEFTITVYYHNTSGYTSSYMKTNVVSGYSVLSSMIQPFFAHEWFACKQSLTDKADSAYVYITTVDSLKVASNGVLTHIDSISNPGFKRYEWKTRHTIDYYLICFAVAGFVEYSFYAKPTNYLNQFGQQDSILIQNFLSPGNSSTTTKNNILTTKNIIEKYSQEICLYPYSNEKYGHYAWNTTFVGMEHQTMSGMNNFASDLVAHELMHQWFGNNVTCLKWNDIWVHEGFAQYSQFLVQQWFSSYISTNQISFFHFKALFNTSINTGNYYNGTKTKSLYILDSEISSTNLTSNTNRIFDSPITYNKGASVVHMIRYILQKQLNTDTVFFKVLRNYIQNFSDSVATGNDFKTILEDVSGLSFTNFFNEWYYGAGYPKYNIRWYQKTANDSLYLSLEQITPATGGVVTPYYTTPIELSLYRQNGIDTIVTIYPTAITSTFSIYVSDSIHKIAIDTADYILDDPNNKLNVKCANFVSIPQSASFCEGSTLLIEPSSNSYSSYQWSNGENSQTITVNQSGTYRLTVTDTDNCRYISNSIAVTANSKPTIAVVPQCYSSLTSRDVEIQSSGGSGVYDNYQMLGFSPQSSSVFNVAVNTTNQFRVQDDKQCWSDYFSYSTLENPSEVASLSSSSHCIIRSEGNTWIVTDEFNQIVAEVDDNGNNIGLLDVNVYIDSTSYQDNQYIFKRHFKVSAQNSLTTPIIIRLFITESELNEIISKSHSNVNNNDDVDSIQNLSVLKYSGINEDDRFDNNDLGCSSCFTSYIPTTGSKYGALFLEISLSGFSEDWIVSKKTGAPLGVDLAEIETSCNGANSIIKWISASEINNQKFILEKSKDGKAYFAIGEVSGAGNSNCIKHYMFEDKTDFSSIQYYRISHVDFNDKQSDFSYIYSDCNNMDINININPNPAFSWLQITGDINLIDTYEFIDLLTHTSFVPPIQNSSFIDISNMKNGIYLLKINTTNHQVKFLKVIKL